MTRARLAASIMSLLIAAAFSEPAPAAVFTVNSTADVSDASPGNGTCATAGGACTLRAAVEEANASLGPDSINLPADTYALSLSASLGSLDLLSEMTISGAGASSTFITGTNIDAVLHVAGPALVAISGVTVGQNASGYGIIVSDGSAALTRVAVSDNAQCGISIAGSELSGGALATISDSTVSTNAGGGVAVAATSSASVAVQVHNTTISGNTTTVRGGGLRVAATSFGNGAVAVSLNNVTITDNHAADGGGIANELGTHPSVNISNTIITGNTDDGSTAPNCWAPSSVPITWRGYNGYGGDSAGECNSGSSDLTGLVTVPPTDLGPLQNNGGTTETHALNTGSIAIDAGNPAAPGGGGYTCEATDQRVYGRPVGAACDIGAYEVGGAPVATPTSTSTPTPTAAPPLCPASPASGCRASKKGFLLLKDHPTNDNQDKIVWRWILGESTNAGEFGIPSATRSYALCVYDANGKLLQTDVPPDAVKWDGLVYTDPTGAASGIRKVVLKPSATDKAKAIVRGKGPNLPDPGLGAIVPPVRAQLVNDETTLCFETTFGAGQVIRNDAMVFKARATPVPPTTTQTPTTTPTATPSERRIWALGGMISGGFGGLAGGDALCQSEGSTQFGPGVYKAWLSDGTASAAARLTHSTVPYRLPSGTKVADDWTDLTDGTLDAPINENATGGGVAPSVWTGTSSSGSASTDHCVNWSSSLGADPGVIGDTTAVDSDWTSAYSSTCDQTCTLYCIEQ